MPRHVLRSFVCSSLALALGAAPSLPVQAATALVATASVITAPADTTAEPAQGDPEALSAAAVERFEAKDYDAAVELFEQAYAADPQPNYLFNIGRVYEEKGDLENAVVYYQRFVGQSGVDLESRQAATERLKVLREALAQMKADEKPPEDEDPLPEDDTVEPVADPGPSDEDAAAAKRKRSLRIAGYSVMGAGGVGLIIGAVFGGLASSAIDDAEADPLVDREIAFRERAGERARVADAMFITGGVLVATGLVLVLATLGGKKAGKGEVSRRTMWSPVVSPQHVGLGLTHRF